MKKPWYRAAYKLMKRREKSFLEEATHVVSLTDKGREVMEEMPLKRLAPISIIPCSADLELFGEMKGDRKAERQKIRQGLGIAGDAIVFVYLGSVGSWYLLEEMLRFFQHVWQKQPEAHFLFISQSAPELIWDQADAIGLPRNTLTIKAALRKEIPALLDASNIGLFFIKPCFSKQASSPTKLGEMLAMGLPVIANGGVGDLDGFFAKNEVGKAINTFDEATFETVRLALPEILALDRKAIRGVSERNFSLDDAVASYHAIYEQIPT